MRRPYAKPMPRVAVTVMQRRTAARIVKGLRDQASLTTVATTLDIPPKYVSFAEHMNKLKHAELSFVCPGWCIMKILQWKEKQNENVT